MTNIVPIAQATSFDLVAERVADLSVLANETNLIDEALQIRSYAQTLETALDVTRRQRTHSVELERSATALRLRAERRTGILIAEGQKRGEIETGGRPRKTLDRDEGLSKVRIDDLGLSWDESSQFAKLAKIDDATFEGALTTDLATSRKAIIKRHARPARSAPRQVKNPYDGLPIDEAVELLLQRHHEHLSEVERALLLELVTCYRETNQERGQAINEQRQQ